MNFHIKEKEWEQILKVLKSQKGLHTRNEEKLRQFMEGIWYVARSGCQWRLLPLFYGH